jgi:ATP-binding cassette subfamily B multidrug efflux pump
MSPASAISTATRNEERSGKVSDWRLLGRLLRLLMPYSWRVTGSVLCALVDMLLQVTGPLLISIAIDRYFLQRSAAGLFANWLPIERDRGLTVLSLVYFAIVALAALVQTLQNYWANWIGEKAMADLRESVFGHLQELEISFFDSNPVGRLVTRVTTDI